MEKRKCSAGQKIIIKCVFFTLVKISFRFKSYSLSLSKLVPEMKIFVSPMVCVHASLAGIDPMLFTWAYCGPMAG